MNTISRLPGESLLNLGKRCDALYICPKNPSGQRTGKLVAYAGKDETGRNLVGDIYFNFRMVELHPQAVMAFAEEAVQKLSDSGLIDSFDTVCGIPNGGRTFGQFVALIARKRFVYPEKKPKQTEPGYKQEYEWELSQFPLEPGERVVPAEDIINNCQNTEHTLDVIRGTGANVPLIIGAFNRSPIYRTEYKGLPIIASISEAHPEFKQVDPRVANDIAAGRLELNVKQNWRALMASMAE